LQNITFSNALYFVKLILQNLSDKISDSFGSRNKAKQQIIAHTYGKGSSIDISLSQAL
jgi:hypothetical protein